jgi:hypothetical protein
MRVSLYQSFGGKPFHRTRLPDIAIMRGIRRAISKRLKLNRLEHRSTLDYFVTFSVHSYSSLRNSLTDAIKPVHNKLYRLLPIIVNKILIRAVVWPAQLAPNKIQKSNATTVVGKQLDRPPFPSDLSHKVHVIIHAGAPRLDLLLAAQHRATDQPYAAPPSTITQGCIPYFHK